MWRFGIMSCLFLLSLARLEIACSPYTFHARNHFLLSVLCCLITFGMPILMDVISTVLYGNSCGFQSQLVMKALYGVDMGFQSDNKLPPIFILFTVIINLSVGMHYFCSRKRNAVAPMRNAEASRMFNKNG